MKRKSNFEIGRINRKTKQTLGRGSTMALFVTIFTKGPFVALSIGTFTRWTFPVPPSLRHQQQQTETNKQMGRKIWKSKEPSEEREREREMHKSRQFYG